MPSIEESLAHQLARDEKKIEELAATCAEAIIEKMWWRPPHYAPSVWLDEPIIRRADKDVEIDFRMDAGYGFTLTDEQREEYRRRYRAGFLAAWRDPAVFERVRAKPHFVIFVCER